MTLPVTIGVESHITDTIVPRTGTLQVRLCVKQGPGAAPLAANQRLRVEVRARVYDLGEVYRRGAVVDPPLADGPPVTASATTEWSLVDVLLPHMAPGRYGVVAKVTSIDVDYQRQFTPSDCFLREVSFGHRFLIALEALRSVYTHAIGDPRTEGAVRDLVRRGEVITRDSTGALFRALEHDDGRLELLPLPQPPPTG